MISVKDSPFYRVTSRALILVNNKLVLVQDASGHWQLPGGGWEHGESFEDCIAREVREELTAEVRAISPICFSYQQLDSRNYRSLRLAAVVTTNGTTFTAGDGMRDVSLVSKHTFVSMQLCPGEGPVQGFAEIIWGGTLNE
jgi:8-oxo-dGTP diphosphatase